MDKISYELVVGDGELEGTFEVRRQVLVAEQDIPRSEEFDVQDREAPHMVVKDDGRVIGTARVI